MVALATAEMIELYDRVVFIYLVFLNVVTYLYLVEQGNK